MAQAEVAASALAAAHEAEEVRAGRGGSDDEEDPLTQARLATYQQLQQSRKRFVFRRWRWNRRKRPHEPPAPSTALLTAQGGRMFWESLSRPLRRVLTYSAL